MMEQMGMKVQAPNQECLASDLTFLEMDVRLGRMKVEPRKEEGEIEEDEEEKEGMLLLETSKNRLVLVVVGLLAAPPTVLVALQISISQKISSLSGQWTQWVAAQ
ncbi:hypothetical protein NL676_027420 [Syzygium grande]|nr:hypothetical protein NL676_027420 [Syzygium grande]